MEKVVAKFDSLEDAERAEWEYYASLTPNQRLEILLDILSLAEPDENQTPRGMARVYRITPLGEYLNHD